MGRKVHTVYFIFNHTGVIEDCENVKCYWKTDVTLKTEDNTEAAMMHLNSQQKGNDQTATF